jgi:hypothetical protein
MKHRVFSARLDKAIVARLNAAVRKNKISKKRFLEEAIAEKLFKLESKDSVLESTFRAWARHEGPGTFRKRVKAEFDKGMKRHLAS